MIGDTKEILRLDTNIPDAILVDSILPFMATRRDLISLATTCKRMRKLLFSRETSVVWDNSWVGRFQVCIDGYCPTCQFNKNNSSVEGAIIFLSRFPLRRLLVHCFLTDIPSCLTALSAVGELRQLTLAFTAKRGDPPLETVLSNALCTPQEVAAATAAAVVAVGNDRLQCISSPPPPPAAEAQCSTGDRSGAATKSRSNTIGAISGSLSGVRRPGDRLHDGRVVLSGLGSLTSLTLDASHLTHAKAAGRARLLDFLGRNLQALSFRHLSPSGAFSNIIAPRCPALTYLRVDRAQTEEDLQAFTHPLLEELELRRCQFILSQPLSPLRLPALRRLRFSASFRAELPQLRSLVTCLPKSITDLSIEVPSSLANQLIVFIGKMLPSLLHLTLEGSYETDTILPSVVSYLGHKCRLLRSIHIRHAKSVHALSLLNGEAVNALRDFPCLSELNIRFDEDLLPSMRLLLQRSISMRALTLWQRQRWMPPGVWGGMASAVEQLNEEFPLVDVRLEDVK